MKRSFHQRYWRTRLTIVVLAAVILLAPRLAQRTESATLTWDVNGATAGTGGAGQWNTNNAFWTSDGSAFVKWVNANGDTAIFGGTTGLVDIIGDPNNGNLIQASGLVFNASGYLVERQSSGRTLELGAGGLVHNTGGTNTLGLDFNDHLKLTANQTWDVGAGSTMLIHSDLQPNSVTVTKTGTGTVTLDCAVGGGAGTLNLNQGTVNCIVSVPALVNVGDGLGGVGADVLNIFGGASGSPNLNVGGPTTVTNSGLVLVSNTIVRGHSIIVSSGGKVEFYSTNAYMRLNGGTSSLNGGTLAGYGAISFTSARLQVNAGATIDPGTTNRAGIISVTPEATAPGGIQFNASSTLAIDVIGEGGVAGVDYDRLAVNTNVVTIGNAALVVNFANTHMNLTGQTLTILTTTTNLTGQSFGSVAFGSGYTGQVNYSNGFVSLTSLTPPPPAGTVIKIK